MFFPFSYRKLLFPDGNNVIKIRSLFIPRWICRNSSEFKNEIYRPNRRYDITVLLKMVDPLSQKEVERVRAYGSKVIFDANVNYFETTGDFFIPGTKPTQEQVTNALWMTRTCDWIVADSTYLHSVISHHTQHVSMIPDNVNLDIYALQRVHKPVDTVTLIWSGVAKKASHFRIVKNVLKRLAGEYSFKIIFVSDKKPPFMKELEPEIACSYVHFSSDRAYARLLATSDIIISPKDLCNSYETAHSEYKITLGMACGLPVVASPQQSYREALGFRNAGFIAHNNEDWFQSLSKLIRDYKLRDEMGRFARQTVVEKYATPVIAQQYLKVLQALRERNG
ncbi:MAG TPA: glycosyltransferase [Candidatus Omnitrophota bacterium]|nr:glycosyltransferase [Candidatus Omnitrophota bacterium]